MNKTVAARETADTMHAAETALATALKEAKTALNRMKTAKIELGMTGTVGDAAIARWAECVATLDEGQAAMIESHQEAYRALKAVNIRGVALAPTFFGTRGQDESRAA